MMKTSPITKTTVINIYGAPGAGKSTLAAEIYAELSKKGESVELVREVAKEKAWTGVPMTVFEQIHVTTEQILRETNLYGKVKYVVTDSPIELGDFYCQYYHRSKALTRLIEEIRFQTKDLINKIDLFVTLDGMLYSEEGRFSTLEESKLLEMDISYKIDTEDKMFYLYENPETRLEDAMKVIYAS